MYAVTAVTGHNTPSVFPTYTSTPLPSWFVLDYLRYILRVLGDTGLSMDISPQVKCFLGSYTFLEGTVISPDLKNPNKLRVAAAHSMTTSGSPFDFLDQKSYICCSTVGVNGRHILVGAVANCAWACWIPACTSRRRGSDENPLGSGSPSVICM